MMPNGEYVIVAVDQIKVSCTDREGYYKELGRSLGYKEGGNNWMSGGTTQPINNVNVGMVIVNYKMGQAMFNHQNHSVIGGMYFLKDDFENIDAKKVISHTQKVYVLPQHKHRFQEYSTKITR